jgi:hypothetical protein
LEFVLLPLPVLRVGRRRFFYRNVWPDSRVFGIQPQPFLQPWLGVRFDRVNWAFRHADPAIDALVRMDDEHVLAFIKAVHRTHFDAIHNLTTDAVVVDDIGQLASLRHIALRDASAKYPHVRGQRRPGYLET